MRSIVIFSCLLLFIVLPSSGYSQNGQTEVTINTNDVINKSYIGNGAEWDPYQLNYGKVKFKAKDIDWVKLYDRLDFMRPQFMRVMINTTSLIQSGKLDFQHDYYQISRILGYCQKHGVTVVLGDWGGSMVNSKEKKINRINLTLAARYVNFLIDKKGFTCIKYYNMINEPNGFWSATDGNYHLWARAVSYFYQQIENLGLCNKLSVIGPDIAIWTKRNTWWIDSCSTHLGKDIGLYDIHTYPSKSTVDSRKYDGIIKAYKEKVPDNKQVVISEMGLKFISKQDSALKRENYLKAKAKPYASTKDSQMFVYNYSYGIDVGAALFQAVNSGFSGVNVWMLDDAFHSKGPRYKLKVWGFWNILGDKFFGKKEEVVRPWYYSWSLLTKYMPTGSRIYKVDVKESNQAVNAIAAGKNNKFMIGLINVSTMDKRVILRSVNLNQLNHVKEFIYSKGTLIKKGDHTILPNRRMHSINLKKGIKIEMPPQSIIVLTTFSY